MDGKILFTGLSRAVRTKGERGRRSTSMGQEGRCHNVGTTCTAGIWRGASRRATEDFQHHSSFKLQGMQEFCNFVPINKSRKLFH